MENKGNTQPQKAALRHYLRVMAFAVVGVIVGLFLTYFILGERQVSIKDTESVVQATTTQSQFARSAPVRLSIEKINLNTVFEEPLGLNEDKTIEVPDTYTKVGWYKHGSTPGEIGPAVVLGHVDSVDGPAVFYSLGKLEAGDEIEITREDGTTAVFKVTELARYDQDEFPTMKVYGPTDSATLRLVTCSGTFNRATQKYSHNLVVYAELVTDETL